MKRSLKKIALFWGSYVVEPVYSWIKSGTRYSNSTENDGCASAMSYAPHTAYMRAKGRVMHIPEHTGFALVPTFRCVVRWRLAAECMLLEFSRGHLALL